MNRRTSQLVALVVTAVAVIACGPVGSSADPSLAPATYDDFSAGLCRSFTSLIRAVGNPDTGSPSVMSKALDDAVAAVIEPPPSARPPRC